MGGLDAEGNDAPLSGDGGGALAGCKFVRLTHNVVGRQHERVAIAFGREQGGDRDRKTSITAHWLEHDVCLDTALAQLPGHDKAEVGIGDDDRSREQDHLNLFE